MKTLTITSPSLSTIALGNMSLDISKGYITDLGFFIDPSGAKGRNYLIVLTGNELLYNLKIGDFEGKGDLIAFGLFSPSRQELKEGTYTIQSLNEIGSSFSVIARNYNNDESNNEYTHYWAQHGTIDVQKSGEGYKLTLDLILSNDAVNVFIPDLSGSFECSFQEIEL